MKKGVFTLIAMILIVMIAVATIAGTYYWISKIHGQMQSGVKEYDEELTDRITKQVDILSFDYDPATYSVHVIMRNIGVQDLKSLGSRDDRIVIIGEDMTCDMAFNSTTCTGCPFDLDINEVQAFDLDFWGTDCQDLTKGTQYELYFAMGDADIRIYTSFIGDIATARWVGWTQKVPTLSPSGRQQHAMAMLDGTDKVILFGGYNFTGSNCDGSDSARCNSTWVYDYSDSTWTLRNTPTALIAKHGHAMATIYGDDKVVIFGGLGSGSCDDSGGSYCNGTWVYDYSDDNWTKMTTPIGLTARFEHAMAAIDETDKAVLFGGFMPAGNCDGSNDNYCNGTWVYDYSDDEWTLMNTPTALISRHRHAMATIDGTDKVVMFGGLSSSSICDGASDACNGTWVYDYSDDDWTLMNTPSELTKRSSLSMATLTGSDRVISFGGDDGSGDCDGSGNNYCNGTWIYDLSKDNWEIKDTPAGLTPRYYSAMSSINGDSYGVLLVGGVDIGLEVKDTWVFA
jgi:N-acetylneuraminic acid mutarotase